MRSDFSQIFSMRFPKFGINKSREIIRLIFEIANIQNTDPENILNSITENNYENVKKYLLKLRYPNSYNKVSLDAFFLPKYEINPEFKADISDMSFSPENIYYEKESKDFPIFTNLKQLFPNAKFMEIESLKSFLKNKSFTIKDYNDRRKNLFIIKEKYDFFKRCPCTAGVVNCGYSIMNIGMGCSYECSYCFLQAYQNIPGIALPFNIEAYLSEDKIVSSTSGFFKSKRIGSGEFTDSLIYDHITNFSQYIINFFKDKKDISFEFKTKSTNIKNLLKNEGKKNIVIAWTVNSEKIAKENEFKAPPVDKRIEAAKICAKAGYSVSFHFDPIVYYDNWKEDYKKTVDMIFDIVPNESIQWISLGTLRMPAIQKIVMENRFPDNKILNGELLLGHDHKLRYDKDTRIEIYSYMNNLVQEKKSKCQVYLCMEKADIWKACGII